MTIEIKAGDWVVVDYDHSVIAAPVIRETIQCAVIDSPYVSRVTKRKIVFAGNEREAKDLRGALDASFTNAMQEIKWVKLSRAARDAALIAAANAEKETE